MKDSMTHGLLAILKGVRCPIHSQKRASYNKSVDILQQTCYQQADIRMRSPGWRQLVDDKSVANPQACYKWFQQVVTSLQMTSCNKPDFNRLVENFKADILCKVNSTFWSHVKNHI